MVFFEGTMVSLYILDAALRQYLAVSVTCLAEAQYRILEILIESNLIHCLRDILLNHVQGLLLIGEHEHRFLLEYCVKNYCGDGMAFASARRPFDYEVFAVVFTYRGKYLELLTVERNRAWKN